MKRLDTLAARLADLLAVAGIGLADLDGLAGKKNPGHAGALVRGERTDPAISTVEGYAAAFGVAPEWLAWGRGARPLAEDVRRTVERGLRRRHAAPVRAAAR